MKTIDHNSFALPGERDPPSRPRFGRECEGAGVILDSVRLEVKKRSRALHGAHANLSMGCDGVDPDCFSADLDDEPVSIKATVARTNLASLFRCPAAPAVIRLQLSGCYVRPATQSGNYQWLMYLHWTSCLEEQQSADRTVLYKCKNERPDSTHPLEDK